MGNRKGLLQILLLVLLGITGCGGNSSTNSVYGNSGGSPPPPAPQGDFALSPELSTVTVQQQGVFQLQTIFLTPTNGFAGTVTVTIAGLPAGVTATPAGPYQISASQDVSFQLSASTAAAAGSSAITLTGTSGSLAHTATFTLTVAPVAPFSIQINPASLSLTPGNLEDVQVSLTANAGTSPSLIVTVSNPPQGSGVSVNGPEYLLTPTSPTTFSVLAAALAQPLLDFPLQVSASDNSGNTSEVTLPLTVVVPSAALGITRSTFLSANAAPTGAVYDPSRKLVFVTVQSLNEVNVYSSTNDQLVASIPTEQPVGIDETADGTKVIVGAQSAYVTIIDPDLLQVVQKVPAPRLPNLPAGQDDYYFPVFPAALSNGQVLFVVRYGYSTEMHVFIWDPAAGTMTQDDFPEADVFAQTLTRSEDHSKVLIYGVSSTGATAALYDVASATYIANGNFNGAYHLALSPNGSQIFAAGIQGNATGFFDDSFNTLASLTPDLFPVSGVLYSRDGQHVYVSGTVSGGGNVVVSINTQTYSVEGVVPDVSAGTDAMVPFDVDETAMIFGAGSSGLVLDDLASPGFFVNPTPSAFQVLPSLLNLSAATPVSLNGNSFDQNAAYKVFFGSAPASGTAAEGTALSVASATTLNVTAPASSTHGPANVTLTRGSDGWFEIIPQAATYGPKILAVSPNAGPPSGGASIVLYGYGLNVPGTQVTIAGQPAQIQQSTNVPGVPFAPITVAAPSGTPGYADITVTTPAGSTTLSRGFQYLDSAVVYPVTGALDDIVYDQTRQRLYATNQPLNRVEVFDLASRTYLSPIAVGKAPSGLAITPDDSLLAVVNSGDGTLSKINLSNGQVAATYPAITANDTNSGCQGVPVSVTAVEPHRMLVDGVCTAAFAAGFIHLVDLDSGVLSCTGFVTCGANGTDLVIGSGLEAMSSTPDGTKVFMTDTAQNSGAEFGPDTLINVTANTEAQNGFSGEGDAAAAADATVFATNLGLHDANNVQFNVVSDLSYVLGHADLPGEKLNPSGSLLFIPEGQAPQSNGLALGVDVFDVHTGRLSLAVVLPEQVPLSLNAMALDETATKMFVISNSGITIASLFEAPLSLARVTPASGASGIQVTLRGSGFEPGSTVQFGSSSALVQFVDPQTLNATVPVLPAGPVRVTVTNPNGSSYSFDAAFQVQ